MSFWVPFLAAAISAGTPLLYATLGGILTERSGHTNLGVEGMMLMGAIIGFISGVATESTVVSLALAAFAGFIGALIYAFLTVSLKTNHIVTGLALSIFGGGFANFLGSKYIGINMPENIQKALSPIEIPFLSEIPVLGDIFFKQGILVYAAYILAIVFGIYLYKTRPGLHLRMVGENPGAADAAGISVNGYRYFHILLGGALCGIGGAYMSMVYVPMWQDNIVAGRGWIAVALIIFATWNPYKAIFGAVFFGGLSIIPFRLQSFNLPISPYFLEMIPYLATALVLIFSSMKKSKENLAPKALGTSYFREER